MKMFMLTSSQFVVNNGTDVDIFEENSSTLALENLS